MAAAAEPSPPRSPAALAAALVAARRNGATLPARDWANTLNSADAAYAVQDEVAAALGWFASAPARYWKSGGASRDAVPTHAALPPLAVKASPARFDDEPLHAPAIEAEIALRLGLDVSPERAAQLRDDEVDALLDAMTVSIEVVDSRWLEGAQASALLRLADLQSHGALALGDWLPYTRRDWAAQRCEVQIAGQAVVVRVGTHSLGDPAWVVPRWLRHATRHGIGVPAGTVVTTGTWVGILPAQAGDSVQASFKGIGSASVQL